jgi:DNA-binding transcriptional ArsR family regulator
VVPVAGCGSAARRRTIGAVVTVAPRFDELIHPSTRLSIVSLLAAADWVDFAFLRDRLGLSDSALSKLLSALEEAGYIRIERPVIDRRRRVPARLTSTGRTAFEGHVAALGAIVGSGYRTAAL